MRTAGRAVDALELPCQNLIVSAQRIESSLLAFMASPVFQNQTFSVLVVPLFTNYCLFQ
jgi:hypothetical protein